MVQEGPLTIHRHQLVLDKDSFWLLGPGLVVPQDTLMIHEDCI